MLKVCSAGSRVNLRSPQQLRSPCAQGAHGILRPLRVLQPQKTPSRQRPRMLTGRHWLVQGLKASLTQLRQVQHCSAQKILLCAWRAFDLQRGEAIVFAVARGNIV